MCAQCIAYSKEYYRLHPTTTTASTTPSSVERDSNTDSYCKKCKIEANNNHYYTTFCSICNQQQLLDNQKLCQQCALKLQRCCGCGISFSNTQNQQQRTQ